MAEPAQSRYRLEELLAVGGMGEVWRAVDTADGTVVAVKRIQKKYANDSAYRRRFFAEASVLFHLAHRHVVTILDYDNGPDGRLQLVTEFIAGPSLADHLADGRTLGPAEAAAMLGQIASALDMAHDKGVVHRDVTPANVLMDELDDEEHGLRLVLIDFGIVSVPESAMPSVTQPDQVIGSADYMAPERWTAPPPREPGGGDRATRDRLILADTYSLGVVLFQMLIGRTPYQGDVHEQVRQHRDAPIPQPCTLRPDLPAAFDEVVARAMAKKPEARFASAGELARAVDAAARGLPIPPPEAPPLRPDPPPPPPPDAGRTRRRRLVLAGAAIVAVALAVGVVVVALGSSTPVLRGEGGVALATTSSGPIAVAGGRAFVSGDRGLLAVDLRSAAPPVALGGPVTDLVAAPDGQGVYVLDASGVRGVDTASASGPHRVPGGTQRLAVVGTGASRQVFVAGTGGAASFGFASPSYTALDVGGTPLAVAADPGGARVWFLLPPGGGRGARLVPVDVASRTPGAPVVGLPAGARDLAVTVDGAVHVSAPGSVTRVEPGSAPVTAPLPTTGDPVDLAPTTDGVEVLTADGAVHLVRDGAVVASTPRTPSPSSRGGLAVDEASGCTAVVHGAAQVDLIGDGGSCRTSR